MSQLRSMYRTGQATMCTEQRLDFQLCLNVKAAAMKDPEGARVSADGQPASRSSHGQQSSALRAAILSIYPDAIANSVAHTSDALTLVLLFTCRCSRAGHAARRSRRQGGSATSHLEDAHGAAGTVPTAG